MTAENQGSGAPEGDDPFAYLYRQEGGGSEGGATTQPGVPRRSYNQVRAVGERTYGRPGVQTAGHPPYEQPGAGSPSTHYAAPETMPGGRAAVRQHGAGGPGGPAGHGQGDGPGRGGRAPRGGGGNRNGLLIVAVAVVAAVVIGIGTAMLLNGDEGAGTGNPQAGNTPTAGAGGGENQGGQKEDADKAQDEGEEADLPKEDAAALRLGGKAEAQSTIPGAKGRNGAYVTGMNAVGSSATWDAEVAEAGTYDLYVRYSVPGKDMKMSLDVNGKSHATGLNMKNFAHAPKDDWEKGWTYTYATVNVEEGRNSFTVSCGQGDKCNALLDQVWLAPPEDQ